MAKRCNDCGCIIERHGCGNCFEADLIRDQYEELGMEVPPLIQEAVRENEKKKPWAERVKS